MKLNNPNLNKSLAIYILLAIFLFIAVAVFISEFINDFWTGFFVASIAFNWNKRIYTPLSSFANKS